MHGVSYAQSNTHAGLLYVVPCNHAPSQLLKHTLPSAVVANYHSLLFQREVLAGVSLRTHWLLSPHLDSSANIMRRKRATQILTYCQANFLIKSRPPPPPPTLTSSSGGDETSPMDRETKGNAREMPKSRRIFFPSKDYFEVDSAVTDARVLFENQLPLRSKVLAARECSWAALSQRLWISIECWLRCIYFMLLLFSLGERASGPRKYAAADSLGIPRQRE
jgi:hypothetical protein